MRTILTYTITFLLGCHFPAPKNNSETDSLTHTLVLETKTDSLTLDTAIQKDSLAIKHLVYRPFKAFKGDTLAYLRTNFVDRTTYYQNRPLAVLLKDLELSVQRFAPIPPYHSPGIDGLYLKFDDDRSSFRKRKLKQVPNTLVILTRDTTNREKLSLLLIKNKTHWTKDTEAFYRDRVVDRIITIYISKPK